CSIMRPPLGARVNIWKAAGADASPIPITRMATRARPGRLGLALAMGLPETAGGGEAGDAEDEGKDAEPRGPRRAGAGEGAHSTARAGGGRRPCARSTTR